MQLSIMGIQAKYNQHSFHLDHAAALTYITEKVLLGVSVLVISCSEPALDKF
jgi:hypothetical protein